MPKATRSEKLFRIDKIRRLIAHGVKRSDCIALAANEWGLKPRSADFYIHEAKQQIAEDFAVDRKEYAAQLLQVLHRVMKKGTQTN